MSHLRYRKAVLAGLLCCVAIALQAAQKPQPASATPGAPAVPYAGAMVSEWTGKVQLQVPGGVLASPTRGQKLPAGTLLDTKDGLIILVLEDESQILLRPGARILLRQPGAGDWNYFELLLGHIRASIKKRTGGAPPFQLGTPSAVIAVRGTRFDVEVNRRGVTEVDVFEGLVEVGAIGIPGASVLVEPGFSTRVGQGSAPEPPIRTYEIRPDAQAPDEAMVREFLREKTTVSEQLLENEASERPDTEINELEEESQEAIEGGNDHDHDDPRPRH